MGQLYDLKIDEYIVEQSKHSPYVEMQDLAIHEHYKDYSERAIICRFNGLWPKTYQLYQWVHNNWATDCDIHLCSKGFFMVFLTNLQTIKK